MAEGICQICNNECTPYEYINGCICDLCGANARWCRGCHYENGIIMRWIKINSEEDLPKDVDKHYLVYSHLRSVQEDKYFYTASISNGEWIIDHDPTLLGVLKKHEHYGYGDRIVTHWSLPQPPEEE